MTTEPAGSADETPGDEGIDLGAIERDVAITQEEVSEELQNRARAFVEDLLAQTGDDPTVSGEMRDRIDSLGHDVQVQAAHQSQMLLGPVKELGRDAGEGAPVARSLTDLRIQVEALDPHRLELSPGWRTRLLDAIPGFGTPLKRYFAKYESAQTTIDAIIRSLETGGQQLHRDNVTLADDQAQMRETAQDLTKEIAFGLALDREIDGYIASAPEGAAERTRAIQENLQFPLRQRILDLQQQLAVQQQGLIATEIIIRNNRELIRGVDRSISVTVTALRTAVSVAFAVAHERIVLDKIGAVSQTTSELISGTAERLRTQGADVHAQAAGAQIDLEHLRSAFADISQALEDIFEFRREALPQMAKTIVDFESLTADAESRIRDFGSPEVEARPPED